MFYELTDGCELTLADIHCKYYKEPPPTNLDSPRVVEKLTGPLAPPDSNSNGYSDDTADYELEPEVLGVASPQENDSHQEKKDEDINIDPSVTETKVSRYKIP